MDAATRHQRDTACQLFKLIAEAADGENVLLSPFSICTALAMAFAGAAGDTELQLRQALKLLPKDAAALHNGYGKVLAKLNDPPNVTLTTANKMYVQNSYSILDSYLELMKNKYQSDLKSVDFEDAVSTSKLINDDVESMTKGKIKDLMDPSAFNGQVRLVLVNAIYFNGSWKEKFYKEATRMEDFFVTPEVAVKTSMMHMEGTQFRCRPSCAGLGCKALELPYEGKRFSMLLLLPDEKDGLAALEEKLAGIPVQSIVKRLGNRKTSISIPKFKLETFYNLEGHLQKLGVTDLFDARSADLSKISGSRDLFVSKVVHKAFIEVNEEGTEAAAATGPIAVLACRGPEPFRFFAHHPFFFAIVDNKLDLVLFSGRYVRPE
ncbi:Leukocyte elastase inhibitor C [Amphibalanus amphitrite]|uniref:Leukocyte elastase inhibitor C n=1 Tax=Amphibalanus amphitrite TaxID=1232801 RepID=A0A6A4WZS1_AMPAM|nr:Leukocyte elastase inhibitor C [Amphibalanus amphitrite]